MSSPVHKNLHGVYTNEKSGQLPTWVIPPTSQLPTIQLSRNPDANKADGQGLPTSAPPKAMFLSQNLIVGWEQPYHLRKVVFGNPQHHIWLNMLEAFNLTPQWLSWKNPKRQRFPLSKLQARSASKDVAPVSVFLGRSEPIQCSCDHLIYLLVTVRDGKWSI